MDKPTASKPRRLRELIAQGTVVLPGAFNALTAMQIQRAGFDAAYVSGAGIAAARGLPDIGLLSLAEVVAEAGLIARSGHSPAVADANPTNSPRLSHSLHGPLYRHACPRVRRG